MTQKFGVKIGSKLISTPQMSNQFRIKFENALKTHYLKCYSPKLRPSLVLGPFLWHPTGHWFSMPVCCLSLVTIVCTDEQGRSLRL